MSQMKTHAQGICPSIKHFQYLCYQLGHNEHIYKGGHNSTCCLRLAAVPVIYLKL